jgi:ATP-dependent helicase/nuclease subunit B
LQRSLATIELKGQNTPTEKNSLLHIVPYGDDPLRVLAGLIIGQHISSLPDLSYIHVLLPDLYAAPLLRQHLLEQASHHGTEALLGPRITTLQNWLSQRSSIGSRIISDYARELILTEALLEHPDLYGKGNPWALTDNLLDLFDELTLNETAMPRDLEDFIRRLQRGYQIDQQQFSGLSREATLVHTLWHAWHEQLHAHGLVDRTTAYVLNLSDAPEQAKKAPTKATQTMENELYIAGFHEFKAAERAWLLKYLADQRCRIMLHGTLNTGLDTETYHPDTAITTLAKQLKQTGQDVSYQDDKTPYSLSLDAVYAAGEVPIAHRAKCHGEQFPHSPLAERLAVFTAADAEEEARAIDVQVRQWLLEGRKRIGIVTENRRLARRVRALLERADVYLDDAAGWALSTTSAATTLERWLQTIEEDFAYEPLLDLLKSPFVFPHWNREELLATTYRLEQDIILHENIPRNLNRYRQHLNYRQNRLAPEMKGAFDNVSKLLHELERAAEPLIALLNNDKHPPQHYIGALTKSLAILSKLSEDAAGSRIIQELEQLRHATSVTTLQMRWQEFRAWLGRALERYNFLPPVSPSPVRLMGLAQSRMLIFDGLIIGAVERDYLPGTGHNSPFFNDTVRRELGLTTRSNHMNVRFYDFRRLLEAAPDVVLTHRREQDGEDVIPSPWLELLQSFHRFAYGAELQSGTIGSLVNHPATQVFNTDTLSLPGPVNCPKPNVNHELLPQTISASAYQELMDCPYQFYAARCLKLTAPEAIRERLEKSDFGNRVHRCLEAFHGNVAELPGPFNQPFTPQTRIAAIGLLEEISHAVFAKDLEDNFQHRGWLKNWLAVIPNYIDWQIERAKDWQVAQVELEHEQQNYYAGVNLKGRLDRMDTSRSGIGLIDYKTGRSAKQAEVESGEAVQLPFYALLAELKLQEPVTRVEYMSLDKNKFGIQAGLDGDILQELKHATDERLKNLLDTLQHDAQVPAWGDEQTCEYCKMQGLCRRSAWVTDVTEKSNLR